MNKKWIIGTALLFLFAFTFSITTMTQTAVAINDPGSFQKICCIKYCPNSTTMPQFYGHLIKVPNPGAPGWECIWPDVNARYPDCLYKQFGCIF